MDKEQNNATSVCVVTFQNLAMLVAVNGGIRTCDHRQELNIDVLQTV